MDNPIIDNEVFNLKSFSIFLLSILKKYIKIFVIIIMVYIGYFFIKPPFSLLCWEFLIEASLGFQVFMLNQLGIGVNHSFF